MWPSPKVPDSIALKVSASCKSALVSTIQSRKAYLGRPLSKRGGLVRIIPSDLVNLVGEVSKQEALYDEFCISDIENS